MDTEWKEKFEAIKREARRQSQQRIEKGQVILGRQVSFFSYMPALSVALLKDLLDLTLIGSLPGIGTIITFCFSILIFLLLMMSGSKQRRSLAKKGLILLIGTITEGLFFGLNLLPIETMTVFFIYLTDKHAGKKEASFEA
jgi:hypothetical protein